MAHKGSHHLKNAIANAWRIQQDTMSGKPPTTDLGDIALVLQQMAAGLDETLQQLVDGK